MQKLIGKTNRIEDTVYINISKHQIEKLAYNHAGFTTIKVTQGNLLFNFPSKHEDYMNKINKDFEEFNSIGRNVKVRELLDKDLKDD